ncbi:ATP-binding cassette domain-containing protein [Pseudomonas sp. Teo4]|uniref:ATP-binding cassette domain-containing protein n=1 Tax=Pseudomonas sp. Teo4 TaxID=3064528 RepID=UPI002AB9E8EA|nr:ATP-binding cassette domain-containing protein [Pseudomonas sp. Teo4]MDZ3993789.1 putative multidrug ABC transporter ATP-binding protein YbhF [Pseudomonas sp. Teo4]
MNLLRISDVSFEANNKTLFKHVNFNAKKGETIGLLGPNGAGKTTLMDLICNIKQPHMGVISNAALRPIYLSQTLSAPPSLRMGDIHTLITNLSSSTPPSKTETLNKLKHWSPTLHERYSTIWMKKPSICSYGEIRSFFTLSLLSMDSDLLILDEPTAGVDPEFRHYIWLGIQNACKEGATVIVSSHYIQEIINHCHRFYMLARQQLEPFANADDFLNRHHASTLDEAFIKASSIS